jgi:EAL domain-containing protein (putative c-di-GMP-specific phosphodiesterase class I)
MTGGTLLDQLLAPGGLRAVFQPIYRTGPDGGTHELHALECLIRGPRGTNLEQAPVLFEYVRRKREEIAVDRACAAAALATASRFNGDPRLSINAHATTLARDPHFAGFLCDSAERVGIAPSRLTLEIIEQGPPLDTVTFGCTLESLRGRGVRIALDDVGVGSSNLKMMLDCRPDYFKIDRYFVSGVDSSPGKRATLEAVVHIASRVGAQVVAEGVETKEELAAVSTIGVPLIQGYLFCTALGVEELLLREPSLRPATGEDDARCHARRS